MNTPPALLSSGPGPTSPTPAWRMPPRPPYTWADWITACLFALVSTAALIGAAEAADAPQQGVITDLRYSSGDTPCSYVGRVTTCNEVDLDELGAGSDFDLSCHQVEFRSPYHWFAGYDCVSEEEWRDLAIGDVYPPR